MTDNPLKTIERVVCMVSVVVQIGDLKQLPKMSCGKYELF